MNQFDLELELQRLRNSGSSSAAKISAAATTSAAKISAKAQIEIAKRELEFKREEMTKIGIPSMLADIWYKQQQVQLAEKAFKLEQANLGFEYLKFSSTLQGPANYFQGADFARGASQRQDVPLFLQMLDKNLAAPQFQGQAQGSPEAMSTDTLKRDLLGNPLKESQDASALAAIKGIFDRGSRVLDPGVIESLDKDELAAFASGGGKLGYDVPRWLRDYQRSKLGTESPLLA